MLKQLHRVAAIKIHPLGLAKGALIPIEPHPFHPVDDGLDGFIRRPTLIRILNAENEDTLLLARKDPIEQGRADPADMEKSCWTGSKTHADLCHTESS